MAKLVTSDGEYLMFDTIDGDQLITEDVGAEVDETGIELGVSALAVSTTALIEESGFIVDALGVEASRKVPASVAPSQVCLLGTGDVAATSGNNGIVIRVSARKARMSVRARKASVSITARRAIIHVRIRRVQ
jgi:predicted trehalose synthase